MKKELHVVAALIKKDDKLFLCQRKGGYRYGLLWEFPCGVVEEGERVSSAIEREIKEEVNLTVKALEVIGQLNLAPVDRNIIAGLRNDSNR